MIRTFASMSGANSASGGLTMCPTLRKTMPTSGLSTEHRIMSCRAKAASSVLGDMHSCGACTTPVARLTLMTPAVEPASFSTHLRVLTRLYFYFYFYLYFQINVAYIPVWNGRIEVKTVPQSNMPCSWLGQDLAMTPRADDGIARASLWSPGHSRPGTGPQASWFGRPSWWGT